MLDRAAAAALVVNVAGVGFSFSHALIGQALYEALAPARRVRAHQRVAETIEAMPDAATGQRLTELAYHFAEACTTPDHAGIGRKAVAYGTAAGDAALTGLAPDEALRWYRQALALLDRLADGDPVERCALDGADRRRPTPER